MKIQTQKKKRKLFWLFKPFYLRWFVLWPKKVFLYEKKFKDQIAPAESFIHKRLDIFIRGVHESKLKIWGRYIKRLFNRNRLFSLPIKVSDALNIPTATEFSALMLNRKERAFSYHNHSTWFWPLSENELKTAQPMSDSLFEKYINAIPTISNIELHPSYKSFLKSYIEETSLYINAYLTRLEKRPDLFPKILWVGSCGFIFNSILAVVAKRLGRYVVGFDHGQGCNIWSSGLTAFVETQVVDEFFTYGSATADAISHNRKTQSLVNNAIKITYNAENANSISLLNKKAYAKEQNDYASIKTVMFVQTLFMGRQTAAESPMPDMIALDWQIRLLKAFYERGYKIIIKPHPESKIQIPDDILNKYGVVIDNGIFEDVCYKADLLFYDYALTTTFHTGMLTDKPILYFHFSDAEYPEGLRQHLNNRIEIVRGWYDEENKAQVNWDDLENHIKNAIPKNDKTICDFVLPSFKKAA